VSSFELIFSLFGLLLGLSLAEVLGGFGKAVKARARVRIGWLTPLLGLLVMLDLTSFWITAWTARETTPVNYLTLMLLLIFTGLYYLAAVLVFPEDPDRVPDFDDHYWANKKFVIGAVFALNIPNYAYEWTVGASYLANWIGLAIMASFLLLLAFAWAARTRRPSVVLLAVLVFLYPLSGTLAALGWY